MFSSAQHTFRPPSDFLLQFLGAFAVRNNLTWSRNMASCVLTGWLQASLTVSKKPKSTKALFSSENWKVFGTVALSFVCSKYYLIID